MPLVNTISRENQLKIQKSIERMVALLENSHADNSARISELRDFRKRIRTMNING